MFSSLVLSFQQTKLLKNWKRVPSPHIFVGDFYSSARVQ